MKIGFDGRCAEENLVGVGKYIRYLVIELDKRGIECVIFYTKKPKYEIKGNNIRFRILKYSNRYVFEQVLIPLVLMEEKFDLYHATGNAGIPIFCPVPSVLTIHDIIPLEISKYFSYSSFPLLSKFSYLFQLVTSIFRANKIVTVSNFVKNELIKKFNISPKKIWAIHSGFPNMMIPGKLPDKLMGKKYILNNGGIDIRKNIDGLIKAFYEVKKVNNDIYLVITGENKRIKRDLLGLIRELNLEKSVIFCGYVDDATLNAIIKSAKLVCYPTLSEGFGFPILEAFYFKVPVISSNNSAIPEISGKAVKLIDPNDHLIMADAIIGLLNNNKKITHLTKLGRERLKGFSWEKAANEYLNLYNSIK